MSLRACAEPRGNRLSPASGFCATESRSGPLCRVRLYRCLGAAPLDFVRYSSSPRVSASVFAISLLPARPPAPITIPPDTSSMVQYSRIVLAERPKAGIEEKHFRKETATLPDVSSLKPNEVIVQVQHLSLDPGAKSERSIMQDARLTCSDFQPCADGSTIRYAPWSIVKGLKSRY